MATPDPSAPAPPTGPSSGGEGPPHGNAADAPDPSSSRWLLWVILAGAAVVRLVLLPDFPDLEADEGLWTNSTKNFVAFGDWFMDGRTHVFLSPVFHAFSLVTFELLGPSIGAARLVSALAGVASTWLVYLLVRRVSGRTGVALVAATLFGFSEWTVLLSRRALIESLQLTFILASAVFVVGRSRKDVVLGGLFMGVALLTKLNAAFMLVVLGAWLLWPREGGGPWLDGRSLARVALFGLAAAGLAGAVYGGLYAASPERFVSAFRFELDGAHFQAADPVIEVGRFGLDPVMSGRTVIELFREDPFLLVLATVGGVGAILGGLTGSFLFGFWALFGTAFFLLQIFQPIRYLYLVSPAVVYFGALTVAALGEAGGGVVKAGRRLAAAALVAYVGFNGAYLAMNAVANRGTRLPRVVAWVRSNVSPDARIMAAGYFATDLPNRTYARYLLARSADDLVASIREYGIDYVIYDDEEWGPRLGEVLAANFEPVQRWDFGIVYRVTGTPPPSTAPPSTPGNPPDTSPGELRPTTPPDTTGGPPGPGG